MEKIEINNRGICKIKINHVYYMNSSQNYNQGYML